MNALEIYLNKLIKMQGPISMASFMAEALGNKEHGYYMKKDPFGAAGDFTTAPEISQMFGEILGLWHGANWLTMGSPRKINLIEIGPGRGTLMRDMLRTMKIMPNLLDALEIHMVEISPVLMEIQKENLSGFKTPKWHHRLSDVLTEIKGEPLLFVANEFFDALPIRQFQRMDDGWHERLICLDDNDDKLCLQLAPATCSEKMIPTVLHRADMGSIAEVCSVGGYILADLADHISQFGGAALIIDYGHDRYGTGDTIQAIKNHQFTNILSDIGDCDLTFHVNFQALKDIALQYNITVFGPTTQGRFLKQSGIESRMNALSANALAPQKEALLAAFFRLTDESQMGSLFKVMALTDKSIQHVTGFEK